MGARAWSVVLGALLVCAVLQGCGATARPPATTTASTPAPPSPGRPGGSPVYAALGASETYGTGAEPVTRGYAYQVRDAIGAATFADLGIPAATLAGAYQTEVAGALALHPTVCTVFFGVNDIRAGVSRDAFMADLRDLIATLRQVRCRTVVVGLPELTQIPAVARLKLPGLVALTADWNDHIAQVTAAGGAVYLSLAPLTAEIAAHPEYIAADGLHPSTIGHTRLADVVVQAMRSAGVVR